MKERAPLGPNKGTASTRRTTQPHISYTDPNTEPLHENGASPNGAVSQEWHGGFVFQEDKSFRSVATHSGVIQASYGASGSAIAVSND
jgi:hypothetical protein